MRLTSRTRAIQAGILCIGCVTFYFLWKLSEAEVLVWVNDQIGDLWKIANPSLAEVISFTGSWVAPVLITIGLMDCYRYWWKRHASRRPPIGEHFNLEQWLDHPSYSVWAAACLWVGQKPVQEISKKSPAYPVLQKIMRLLETGQIRSMFGGSSMAAKVGKGELIRLADMLNERPKFLFAVAPAVEERVESIIANAELANQRRLERKQENVAQSAVQEKTTKKAVAQSTASKSAQADSADYLTPHQVVHYLAEDSAWGAQLAREKAPDGSNKNVLLEAPTEFQERAAEGLVRVYGTSLIGSKQELIDKAHWKSYGFDLAGLFEEPYVGCQTAPTVWPLPAESNCYCGLKIDAKGVYRAWPRKRQGNQ